MTNPSDLREMLGRTALDSDGNKIGKVGQIYLDDQTGEPTWVTVQTGLFGTKESFAPLYGSRREGDDLMLAVSKDLVKDAPSIDADEHTSDDENAALYQHYSGYMGNSGQQQHTTDGDVADRGVTDVSDRDVTDRDVSDRDVTRSGSQGHDTSGPNTDDAMTRSEERLHVGTESTEVGRARLRKYIVTEDVTTTVPVSHEEVRIEREPITDANRGDALAGGDITEEEHEVTLHAERAVAAKETVPVERVRLATETVTDEQQVTEQVRKEQIEQVDADTKR